MKKTTKSEEIVWDIVDKLNYILQFNSKTDHIFLLDIEGKKRFVVNVGLSKLPIKLQEQYIEWDGTTKDLTRLHKFVTDYHTNTVQQRKLLF